MSVVDAMLETMVFILGISWEALASSVNPINIFL